MQLYSVLEGHDASFQKVRILCSVPPRIMPSQAITDKTLILSAGCVKFQNTLIRRVSGCEGQMANIRKNASMTKLVLSTYQRLWELKKKAAWRKMKPEAGATSSNRVCSLTRSLVGSKEHAGAFLLFGTRAKERGGTKRLLLCLSGRIRKD